jgi:hypothetical protein
MATGEEAKPGFDITAWWRDRHGRREGATASLSRSLTGMGDHPSGITLYASIVMGLYQRHLPERRPRRTSLLANGIAVRSWRKPPCAAPNSSIGCRASGR